MKSSSLLITLCHHLNVLLNKSRCDNNINLNNNNKNNLKTQLLKHNYWGVNLLEPYTLFFALTATQLRDYESSTLLTSDKNPSAGLFA